MKKWLIIPLFIILVTCRVPRLAIRDNTTRWHPQADLRYFTLISTDTLERVGSDKYRYTFQDENSRVIYEVYSTTDLKYKNGMMIFALIRK